MKINVVVDDELIKEALNYAKVKTKHELIATALQEYVKNHKRLNILKLRGTIKIRNDYDYKKLRNGK